MAKYTKYALVLLYVAQLIVAFRTQLVHLYKNAMDTVHRETALNHETRPRMVAPTLHAARPTPLQTISALSTTIALTAIVAQNDEPDFHEQHQDDKYKDRLRKPRKMQRYEFLLINLYPLIREHRATPAAREARGRTISGADIFPKLAHVT